MSENEEQNTQSSDLPRTGYEAAEEERQSLKKDEGEEEKRNAHVASLEEEPMAEPTKQQKRDETKGKRYYYGYWCGCFCMAGDTI
jgi:hypothetical protein